MGTPCNLSFVVHYFFSLTFAVPSCEAHLYDMRQRVCSVPCVVLQHTKQHSFVWWLLSGYFVRHERVFSIFTCSYKYQLFRQI